MIYYYGQPHPAPSGGMIVQLQHVRTLNQAGIPATFLVAPKYRPGWIDLGAYDVTHKRLKKVRFQDDDILVVPEYVVHEAADLDVRKIAHIQNWGQVKKRFDVFYHDKHVRGLDPGVTYQDLGYTHGITCGGALTNLLKERLGIDLPLLTVTNYVDVPPGKPVSIAKGRVLISDVNSQGFQILKPLWDLYSELWELDATLHVLPPVPREQFLQELRETDVYLHIKYPEGMPLKPLEAMCCRSAVVGFSGGGGLEYMKHEETALVVEDGNFHSLLEAVRRVIQEPSLRDRLRENGYEKARTFTVERFRTELLEAWETLLD